MKRFAILALCMLITACSIVSNNVQYVYMNSAEHDSSVSKKKTCAKFELPEWESIPPIPLEDYSAARNDNGDKVLVLVSYIERLRLHVSDTKKSINARYQQYLSACDVE